MRIQLLLTRDGRRCFHELPDGNLVQLTQIYGIVLNQTM